jgi:hypothetical protein
MKRCAAAVETFAQATNESTSIEEIRELLKAPTAGGGPSGIPLDFPFLGANGNASSSANNKKRAKSSDSESETPVVAGVDENGKKRKKTAAEKRKDKDPNAPKRPMSAYLMFQNAVRQQVKDQHPEAPYKDIMTHLSEAWKELGESGQKVRPCFFVSCMQIKD